MKKAIRIIVYIAFVIYCLALIKVLLLDGRYQSTGSLWDAFGRSNLIPGKTVYDYMQKLIEGRVNTDTVIINLVGNLIVLFPMGCFLPCIFRTFRRFPNTALLCLGMIVTVELIQPVLRIGSLDIDDLIFNLSGACLGYATVHIPFVRRILERSYIYR